MNRATSLNYKSYVDFDDMIVKQSPDLQYTLHISLKDNPKQKKDKFHLHLVRDTNSNKYYMGRYDEEYWFQFPNVQFREVFRNTMLALFKKHNLHYDMV